MTKVDLSKYDNSWYNHGPLIKRILWIFFGRVFVNSYLPFPSEVRAIVLRLFGAKIGKKAMIKPKVNIKYPWQLVVGNFVWIGENVWIDNLDLVRIEDNACISQGAMLLTGNHNYKSKTFDLIVKKIVIEEGAWIGAKSLVNPGIICGSHSVLGAGSVLSRNLPSEEIWAGNPAIFVRKRIIE